MTAHDDDSMDEEGNAHAFEELLDEDTACQQHTAYMACQGAHAETCGRLTW